MVRRHDPRDRARGAPPHRTSRRLQELASTPPFRAMCLSPLKMCACATQNTEALAKLAAAGVNVQPSPESVAIIQVCEPVSLRVRQYPLRLHLPLPTSSTRRCTALPQDKLLQKQYFIEAGVAVPDFMDTPDVPAVEAAGEPCCRNHVVARASLDCARPRLADLAAVRSRQVWTAACAQVPEGGTSSRIQHSRIQPHPAPSSSQPAPASPSLPHTMRTVDQSPQLSPDLQGGYDGRGNYVLKDAKDAATALEVLAGAVYAVSHAPNTHTKCILQTVLHLVQRAAELIDASRVLRRRNSRRLPRSWRSTSRRVRRARSLRTLASRPSRRTTSATPWSRRPVWTPLCARQPRSFARR